MTLLPNPYSNRPAPPGDVSRGVGLILSRAHSRAELGYWVAAPYWGQGFATEAGRAVLDFGFGPLGLHRIQAHYMLRNPASGRVLEKLGMKLEGVHYHALRKWDAFEDVAQRAILVTDRDGGEGG